MQAIKLAEFLMNKGSYGIATFYLSLIESSEQLHGLPAHYQLAGELKQIGIHNNMNACLNISNNIISFP